MRKSPFSIFILFLGCAWLVVACVTDFQPDPLSIPSLLVVEGFITNQPGPYTVRLSRTTNYTYQSLNLLETGAVVVISDTLGNRETLQERAGVYSTKAGGIQGVVGRTYTLTIKTKDGTLYESDPERLKACPPISRLYYEYAYNPGALTNDRANVWNVFVDTKDPDTPGDFYRWEWTHYEFLNYCASKQVMAQGQFVTIGTSCCSNCWNITHCYNCINIQSDVAINGHTISRQPITQVTYNGATRYYIEVRQQVLSRAVYTFFQQVNKQINQTGGLFDAAPSSISTNIHAVGNPAVRAYGYFGAAGESEAYVLVDRSTAKGPPTYERVEVDPLLPCVACRSDAYQTPVKPRWWSN